MADNEDCASNKSYDPEKIYVGSDTASNESFDPDLDFRPEDRNNAGPSELHAGFLDADDKDPKLCSNPVNTKGTAAASNTQYLRQFMQKELFNNWINEMESISKQDPLKAHNMVERWLQRSKIAQEGGLEQSENSGSNHIRFLKIMGIKTENIPETQTTTASVQTDPPPFVAATQPPRQTQQEQTDSEYLESVLELVKAKRMMRNTNNWSP